MALLKNDLHDFATHNYVWTLSAMYPGEINDPEEYRGTIGKLPIVGSGGLGNRKTVITESENKLDVNVEFYIDNIRILNSIGINAENPVTATASIEFAITEPYSIGLFMQTMAISANKAGFSNYSQAPFLLSCTFKGQKQDGSYNQLPIKNWVIKIAAVTMTVNASGSIYEVIAHPWNHENFFDSINTIRQDVRLEGSTVGEILSSGENSLATLLNKYEITQETNSARLVPNVYQIAFPFDIGADADGGGTGIVGFLNDIQGGLNKVNNVVQSIGTVGAAIGNLGTVLSSIGQPKIGFGAGAIDPGLARAAGLNGYSDNSGIPIVNNTFTQIGASISSFANQLSISGIASFGNEIGQSQMIESFNEFGDVPFGKEEFVYDKSKAILRRKGFEVNNTARVYTFSAGTQITEVIETIVLLSKFGQQLINQTTDSYGYNRYFKVHAKKYILSTAELGLTGRLACKYVYEVIPYFFSRSRLAQTTATNNYEANINDVVKAYNYVYTGLNRDVLDFEIRFDSLYTQMIPAGRNQYALHDVPIVGNHSAFAETQLSRNINTTINEVQEGIAEFRSTVTELLNLYRVAGGTFIDNARTQNAFAFRQAILSAPELQTLELTIYGDPYYLNDSDWGNYVANPLGPNINADLTMESQRAEVQVLVNFNSAVDYKNNLLMPDPTDAITGIYRIDLVESTFEGGQFKQILTMQRLPNPDTSTLGKVRNVVNNFFNLLGAVSNFASVVGAEQVASAVSNFMVEAAPVAQGLLNLTAIGENIQTIAAGNYSNVVEGLSGLEALFGQVGALQQQVSQLRQSIPRIDANPLTPALTVRPPRPPSNRPVVTVTPANEGRR
jgi:hypothetical protein